jgi:pyruvate dehydrogenase E2 component (dihydrolipoamide acetyltransferase)
VEDVQAHLESKGRGVGAVGREALVARKIALTPIRRTISERLTSSLRSAAHVTLLSEVDVTRLVEVYKSFSAEDNDNQEEAVDITYTDLFVKLVADLLPHHSFLNSSLDGDEIRVFEDVNIGIATSLEGGLVVPVIRNADRRSVVEIAKIKNDLVAKARNGLLTRHDLEGGTFTISNLGHMKVDGFTPIINPPQTAILGIGRIVEKPVVRKGEIAVGSIVTLSLTFDHRVIDGADAAKFLNAFDESVRDQKLFRGKRDQKEGAQSAHHC